MKTNFESLVKLKKHIRKKWVKMNTELLFDGTEELLSFKSDDNYEVTCFIKSILVSKTNHAFVITEAGWWGPLDHSF